MSSTTSGHWLIGAVLALSGAAALTPLVATAEPAARPAAAPGTTTAQPPADRVTGIGGIFIKAKDPAALRAWYGAHLGIDVQPWGGTAFRWQDKAGRPVAGTTAWSVSKGKNFAPSTSTFMVNYRVADLRALLTALRAEGCTVLDDTEESEYGRFGWVMDPEGNKVELWEPPAGQ